MFEWLLKLYKKDEYNGKFSKYFTYDEMIQSEYAIRHNIDNIPSILQIENLKYLCRDILDKVRQHFNKPIFVTSGFRNAEVNKGIGGSKNSQHKKGEAADFIVTAYDDELVWRWIVTKSNLNFDQCIWEFDNWVHISYSYINTNRNKITIAIKENGKTKYTHYTKEQILNGDYCA